MAGPASPLDVPLHAYLGVLAQRRRRRAAATTDAFNAAARAAAYAVEAAARAADSGTDHSDGFNLKFAEASGADPVTAAFWSAVSNDATHVEEGAAASVIAGSPLWPQGHRTGSGLCGRK